MQPYGGFVCDRCVNDASIWRKHQEELVRYATILVGPDHAEDVLSNVVVRVMNRRGSLASLDDARPYLFRAVLNESRNHVRRRSRPSVWVSSVDMPVEIRPDVIAAVGSLPARQRAAVYLTYWRDLRIKDVAELMGCRPGTVKRYLFLARRRLKETLEQ